MPDGQELDESRAEAITPNLDPPQVVGWNEDRELALLWRPITPPPFWEVTDLNDEIGSCAGNLDVARAHDVNDSGWIVCLADYDTGPGFDLRAVLLTPVETCRWDIAPPEQLDGTVSVLDFLLLLAQWGPCPAADFCTADFDCSGDVDVPDFLELLENWGPCDGDSAASPPDWLLDLVDVVGFDDPALLEALICAAAPDLCQD
jgi:hypothetical protein